MPLISICIPTRQGSNVPDYVLPYYDRQIYKDYELLVHEDTDGSAAAARNKLAQKATGKYLLFVGDDCIPDRSLVYRYQQYLISNPEAMSVQGFSPFHPAVMDTYFMHFLDRSGIQANWYALLNDDKSWKTQADGFCLTTNYLIQKDVFNELGGFNERFPGAAWEDIEFGERLVQYGGKTTFLPNAQNYHWHKYKFTEYVNRQKAEGRNRVVLATVRPESAGAVLSLDGIKNAKQQEHAELEITNRCINMLQSAHTVKEARPHIDSALRNALNLFSFFGVREAIQNTPFLVLEHCKNNLAPVHVSSAIKAIEQNSYAYALHCCGWLENAEGKTWYTNLFEALIHSAFNEDLKASKIMVSTAYPQSDWSAYVFGEIHGKED